MQFFFIPKLKTKRNLLEIWFILGFPTGSKENCPQRQRVLLILPGKIVGEMKFPKHLQCKIMYGFLCTYWWMIQD